MHTVIRTLLIWMLALAVPLQGSAAVTMAFCDSSRHSAADAAPRAHSHVHRGTEHAAGTPASHGGHGAAASLPGAAHQEPPSSDVGKASSHKCSACASCCSVGALPTMVLTVPAPGTPPAFFATLAPAVDAFTADGPDRPPRPVQA